MTSSRIYDFTINDCDVILSFVRSLFPPLRRPSPGGEEQRRDTGAAGERAPAFQAGVRPAPPGDAGPGVGPEAAAVGGGVPPGAGGATATRRRGARRRAAGERMECTALLRQLLYSFNDQR